MLDLFFANEVVACRVVGGDNAAGIAPMRSKAEIELLALIDLIDRHQRTFLHLARHHGVGARSGKDETEWRSTAWSSAELGCCEIGSSHRNKVELSPVIADRNCVSFGQPGIKKFRPLIDKSVGAKTQSFSFVREYVQGERVLARPMTSGRQLRSFVLQRKPYATIDRNGIDAIRGLLGPRVVFRVCQPRRKAGEAW